MSIVSSIPTDVTNNKRVAIYLHYSAEMSAPQSLEDQERDCRNYAEAQGWVVLDSYIRGDAAKTGRRLKHRGALESLMEDARQKPRPFDVLMVDELSRLSRELNDVLSLVQILRYLGIKVYVLSQQLDSDNSSFEMMLTMHRVIGEQYKVRLRHRVRRGQESRIRDGFMTGSRCFGYKSVSVRNSEMPEQADLGGVAWEVVESEAATIRHIYELYANGHSAYKICLKLNEEGVPAGRKARIGPDRTVWNTSLVKSILQNEKYIGKVIWNKTTQMINPITENRVTRKNPTEVWVHKEHPELRIVSDELSNRVLERRRIANEQITARRIGGLNRAKKCDHPLS